VESRHPVTNSGLGLSGKVCPVTIFANTRHARPEKRDSNIKLKMEKPWTPTSIS
jgi:hypothetical protein